MNAPKVAFTLQNKIGDKFLGRDGQTSWEIIDRAEGRFIVRTVWGSKPVVKDYHLSAQKLNAMVIKGELTRVK